MADNRPGSPDRKLSWIPPLTIAGVIAAIAMGAFFLTATGRASRPAPAVPAPAPPLPTPVPLAKIVELPPPPLTRTELIQNAAATAAAFALGSQPPAGKSPLVGRSFELRIPFGCDGPGHEAAAGLAYLELDPKTSSLKLVARPANWTSLPAAQGLGGTKAIESIEGFWLPRPWMNSQDCPPHRDLALPATPTPPAAQTIGLAQIFEAGGSRVLARGDRPYVAVIKPDRSDAPNLTQSYRLVLEGRLLGFDNGRAVRCWSESDDHRPVCLYAVAFDRVAFEDADTSETVAEWTAQ